MHVTDHVWLSLIQVLLVVDLILKLSAVDHLRVRMPNCGLGEMNLRATYQRYQWPLVNVSNRHVRRLLMMRCSCIGLQREYPQLSLKVWKVSAFFDCLSFAMVQGFEKFNLLHVCIVCLVLIVPYKCILFCYNVIAIMYFQMMLLVVSKIIPGELQRYCQRDWSYWLESMRTIFDINLVNLSHLLLLVIEALTTDESYVC